MSDSIVVDYLAGLAAAWDEVGDEESPREFAMTHGASDEDIARLRAAYPLCPDALVELLRRVDGTVHMSSGLVLGSDVEEGGYPYYLLPVAKILEYACDPVSAETIRDHYGDDLDEYLPVGRGSSWADLDDDLPVWWVAGKGNLDDRIDPDLPESKWLHFSDCVNSGGSSQLFIDFDPLGSGRVGQVARFLHDPDSYDVIADSFEDYLQCLIDSGYPFVHPLGW
ncbi:MAG: SMI1/KNR4 family protein [Micrococcales bacterium]|nr:SMI1/KNR4 family protein [Micrococcales bacterium]MCL2667866.1 SMI1/KNR4 family protein [Micrococcales bacterium]